MAGNVAPDIARPLNVLHLADIEKTLLAHLSNVQELQLNASVTASSNKTNTLEPAVLQSHIRQC